MKVDHAEKLAEAVRSTLRDLDNGVPVIPNRQTHQLCIDALNAYESSKTDPQQWERVKLLATMAVDIANASILNRAAKSNFEAHIRLCMDDAESILSEAERRVYGRTDDQ